MRPDAEPAVEGPILDSEGLELYPTHRHAEHLALHPYFHGDALGDGHVIVLRIGQGHVVAAMPLPLKEVDPLLVAARNQEP